MKKLYMLSLTALLMAACAEEVTEKGNNGDFITFNVTDNNLLPEPTVSTAAAEVPSFFNQSTVQTTVTAPTVSTPEPVKVETDLQLDEPLYMTTTVEKGIHTSTEKASTMRGTLVNTGGTLNFGVTEYKNDPETAIFTNYSLSTTANTTAQTVSTTKTWESDANTNAYDFYAYAPYLSSASNGLTLSDGKTIKYDASAVTLANQKDLMTAYASSTYNKDGVALEFGHRLTAVTVKLNGTWSSTYTIKSIVFNNIDYAGDCSLTDGSWSNMTNGNYTVNAITESSTASANVAVNLMMIPQTFGTGTNAKMTITLQETANSSYTHTLSVKLNESTLGTGKNKWEAGHTVTYVIGAQGISTFQAVYPNGANAWGGTTQGPVNSYDTTDAESCGMFVVDASGKIVYSNVKMTNGGGTTATLTPVNKEKYFFSKNYTYFLYYPYKTDSELQTIVGSTNYTNYYTVGKNVSSRTTNADTFLGNVSSGWDVKEDQNDETKFRKQDLQFGMSVGTSGTVSATMEHKMGLISVALADHDVYDMLYYDGNTYNASNNPKWTVNTTKSSATKTTWAGSSTFTGTYTPFVKNKVCYQVVEPGADAPSYTATIDNTNKKYPWTQTCTAVASANGYASYNVDYDVDFISACWEFSWGGTGQGRQWVAPTTGTYTMECWGANGGVPPSIGRNTIGIGGYVSGNILLSQAQTLYIFVGQQGIGSGSSGNLGGWNGGGSASYSQYYPTGGGGATDIRILGNTNSTWKNDSHLRTRIMVAAGGGGCGNYTGYLIYGGHGGGLIGYRGTTTSTTANGGYGNYNTYPNTGGTQTSGGTFYITQTPGFGYAGFYSALGSSTGYAGGGGGGWYGGVRGYGQGGSGGSSFISGHPGCNAVNPSTGAHLGASTTMTINGKEYRFISGTTRMIDGSGKQWTTASQTTGGTTVGIPAKPETTNHGYCRITYIP